MHERFHRLLKWIQHYSDRWWYPILVGVLAGLDNWILIVPTDGLFISGVMLAPKRWLQFSLLVPILSSIGGITFAAFIGEAGLPYLQSQWPGLTASHSWQWTESFFISYGMVVVFLVAASPLTQQPALMIAALAKTPYLAIFIVVLAGRTLKYMILGLIAARAPAMLAKLWGFKGEMRETGVLDEGSKK